MGGGPSLYHPSPSLVKVFGPVLLILSTVFQTNIRTQINIVTAS